MNITEMFNPSYSVAIMHPDRTEDTAHPTVHSENEKDLKCVTTLYLTWTAQPDLEIS